MPILSPFSEAHTLWSNWTMPLDRRSGKAEQAQTPRNLRIENGGCGASSLPNYQIWNT